MANNIRVTADFQNNVSPGIKKISNDVDDAGGHVGKMGSVMTGIFQGVGQAVFNAAANIAHDLVGIGVSSAKAAVQFHSDMLLIQTQAGATAAEVGTMSTAVLSLAGEVGLAPDVLATGLFHVESAGLRRCQGDGGSAGRRRRCRSRPCRSGGRHQCSDRRGPVRRQGRRGHDRGNGIAQCHRRCRQHADAGSHRRDGTGVLSTAKNYGVSLQSIGAALASMTDQGIPAVDAATRLNSAMRLMAAPTGKAVNQLKAIGLSSTDLANDMRGPGGMLAAIQDLKTHLDEYSGLSLTAAGGSYRRCLWW